MIKPVNLRSSARSHALATSTKEIYAKALKRFKSWCADRGIYVYDDETIAEFLVDLYDEGLAPSTITTYNCAIVNWTARCGLPNPNGIKSQETLTGLRRMGGERGRGQSEGLTVKDYERIMSSAIARRPWHDRLESENHAESRGRLDRVIVTLLFMGAMRRSEVAALRWKDINMNASTEYVFVRVVKSKTNQDGRLLDIRLLKGIGAAAVRDLRSHVGFDTDLVVGLAPYSISRRFSACCRSIGLVGRYTTHSGRIGLASELSAAGASITEIAKAGNWKSPEMVIHYSRRASLERGAVATYLDVTE